MRRQGPSAPEDCLHCSCRRRLGFTRPSTGFIRSRFPCKSKQSIPREKWEQLGLIITLCSVASVSQTSERRRDLRRDSQSLWTPGRPGSPAWPWPPRQCVSWRALHLAILRLSSSRGRSRFRAIHCLGLSFLCAAGLCRRRQSPGPWPADRRRPRQYDPHHGVDCGGGRNRLAHLRAHSPTQGVLAGLCRRRPWRGKAQQSNRRLSGDKRAISAAARRPNREVAREPLKRRLLHGNVEAMRSRIELARVGPLSTGLSVRRRQTQQASAGGVRYFWLKPRRSRDCPS